MGADLTAVFTLPLVAHTLGFVLSLRGRGQRVGPGCMYITACKQRKTSLPGGELDF